VSSALTIRDRALPEIRRIAILCSLLIFLIGGSAIFILTDPVLASRFSLSRTAVTLHQRYAGEELDWNKVIQQAYEALFEPLDRYSGPVRESQFQRMDEEEDGSYSGIGVSVLPDSGSLLIVGIREGGPAASAGLENGDRIIQIDTTLLTLASVEQSVDLLRGKEGTSVAVEVLRRSTKDTVSYKLNRKKLTLIHVPYAGFADSTVGYVRLLDFDPGAADEVEKKIRELQKSDGKRLTSFILDLRSNPGGLLNEAIELADLFLPDDSLIVGTSARSRWRSEEWRSTGGDLLGGIPMVVLVDGNSASAAEIVAGALKQNGRAQLVGDTTFGKGLVQGFRRFPDNSGVKLTQARYYLRGGLYLNDFDSTFNEIGRGLVPNVLAVSLEENAYTLWLELDGHLEEFATTHADELMRTTRGGFLPGIDWVSKFQRSLESSSLYFSSISTRRLRLLSQLASLGLSGQVSDSEYAYVKEVQYHFANMLTLSESDDKRIANGHDFYISYRLAQIAWERRGGLSGVYEEVIVPHHPVIRRAVELLQTESTPSL
jgi:C-terminal peptidase prc